jgi:hypothetical protein
MSPSSMSGVAIYMLLIREFRRKYRRFDVKYSVVL